MGASSPPPPLGLALEKPCPPRPLCPEKLPATPVPCKAGDKASSDVGSRRTPMRREEMSERALPTLPCVERLGRFGVDSCSPRVDSVRLAGDLAYGELPVIGHVISLISDWWVPCLMPRPLAGDAWAYPSALPPPLPCTPQADATELLKPSEGHRTSSESSDFTLGAGGCRGGSAGRRRSPS